MVSLASAIVLFLLAGTRFSRWAVLLSVGLIPFLVFLAPSPLALVVTIATEVPLIFALSGPERWNGRAVLVCCFANSLTQPLLYSGLTRLSPATAPAWATALAAAELAVAVVEALLYLACLPDLRRSKAGIGRALAMSFAANAASAGLGLLLPM